MIDLQNLRRIITAASSNEAAAAAVVTMPWLQQVERELTTGAAALAELAAIRAERPTA